MLRRATVVVAVAILACMAFSAAARAQTNDVYWANYFSNNFVGPNTAAYDQFVYIVNPGAQGAPINPLTGLVSTAGYLCANLYVFDNRQEMLECCSCPISPDGLISLSLRKNLLASPLTGYVPASGVIKLVASLPITVTSNGVSATTAVAVCDAGEIGSPPEIIVPDLRAWGTQLQMPYSGVYITTQSAFEPAPLSAAEATFLPFFCNAIRYLGTGQGICTCSTPG